MRTISVLLSAYCLLLSNAAFAQNNTLSTHAERTQFVETGRYAEVAQLCQQFQKNYPKQVRCFSFGTSPQGRSLWALAANSNGHFTAALAKANRLPVTLFQGGIHAGEIDGKDAGFLVLRELLAKPGKDNPLNKQIMLFVPIFNVDGHERFGAYNRPNQRGPKEMGWRTTAQNFNLNRDYMKADTPEMQAMLALVNAWDPLFYVDLHVTDGAKFQHDISVQIDPLHAGDAMLRAIGMQYQQTMMADLEKTGSLPLPYYPSFIENDNPASGFADNVSTPRFSTGYFLLRNRFGVLVETHSWKPYNVRVKATAKVINNTLQQVAQHGQHWLADAKIADVRAAQLVGADVALDYQTGKSSRIIDFQGYSYTRTPSDVSGGLMTHYDESKPQVWKLPLFDDISASLMVNAPLAGYVVAAEFADFIEAKLAIHGIASQRLSTAHTAVAVETFKADTSTFNAQSFESHQALKVTGNWQSGSVDIAKNSLFIPIAQSKSRLIMALLEPRAPDSFLSWGFFNNRFERKEYMENYVAEEVAREMLKDPAIKAKFDAKLIADKTFAASPEQRLEFFARQHSSWDMNYQAYPILRTDIDFSGN